MNIYLVSRTDDVDYDQYDAFVVAATDADDARAWAIARFEQTGDYDWTDDRRQRKAFESATIELVGTAVEGRDRGEILGSFNAG